MTPLLIIDYYLQQREVGCAHKYALQNTINFFSKFRNEFDERDYEIAIEEIKRIGLMINKIATL